MPKCTEASARKDLEANPGQPGALLVVHTAQHEHQLGLQTSRATCSVRSPLLPPGKSKFGRHLVGGMDWWRMEWLFSRIRNYFSEAEICRKIPAIPQKERFLTKFQAPNFEISEPEKMQFHTPNHSIPPLDSLYKWGLAHNRLQQPRGGRNRTQELPECGWGT